ncbi:MAG: ABC transporter permease [Bryobacteraceae bacterium]|nr:ABC transporter permease [Solibacteraceae bacterium]MCO5349422.1 ABC transporter permease [Bryobacteraceae bacterium]
MWQGDILYLTRNLIARDFNIRYRNMSLGMLWSILNPLVMMGVLTLVFTVVFPSAVVENFAVFVLTGMVPYNLFTLSWSNATMSLADNSDFIKRAAVPRALIPVTSVLSSFVNMLVQVGLLLGIVLAFGYGVNWFWLWLPLLWLVFTLFLCGLGLLSASLAVFVRDMRYVVESTNTLMFWLVPIFYPATAIPERFRDLYLWNPVAALVVCGRSILLEGSAPPMQVAGKLVIASIVAASLGAVVFWKLKRKFYDYL